MSNKPSSLFTRIGIFAVLIAIFFWFYQDPQRDETGTIVEAGNINPIELFAGDCYKEEFVALEQDEFKDQHSVEGVPCTALHNNEVFATYSSLISITSDQDVFTQMTEECYDQLGDYVGFAQNVSDEDIMRFDAEYGLLVIFTQVGTGKEADSSKPFSCIMTNNEKLTSFPLKNYFTLEPSGK